jgi:hypothetical protein
VNPVRSALRHQIELAGSGVTVLSGEWVAEEVKLFDGFKNDGQRRTGCIHPADG